MFNNLIRKYYALDDVELNLGSGGDSIGVDKIGAVSYEVVKQAFGAAGSLTLVSPADPLPVTDAVAEAALASLAAEDFATQTTLAAILAKIIAAPATEATLASILAKIIAAPSTEAKQDVIITALNAIDAGTAAALGQAAMAASVPVVIASNQSAVPVSISSGGGGAVTIADGADVAEGAVADAVVAAGAAGTVSAKLRAISRDIVANIVLAAGNNNIGDVDIASIAAGNNNIGDVDVASVAGNVTVIQPTGTNLHTVVDSGTITAVTAITNNVNTVEVAPTTIFNNKTVVTTAGTRVVLAASQAVKSVTIKALSTNTGFIYVGNATVASTNGFQLSAGDTVSMDIANLTTVNIDSSVNGEGVSFIAVQ